jgi:hypothetical protein
MVFEHTRDTKEHEEFLSHLFVSLRGQSSFLGVLAARWGDIIVCDEEACCVCLSELSGAGGCAAGGFAVA